MDPATANDGLAAAGLNPAAGVPQGVDQPVPNPFGNLKASDMRESTLPLWKTSFSLSRPAQHVGVLQERESRSAGERTRSWA